VLPDGVAESLHINVDPNASAAGKALDPTLVLQVKLLIL
jgi:hypothetical protein